MWDLSPEDLAKVSHMPIDSDPGCGRSLLFPGSVFCVLHVSICFSFGLTDYSLDATGTWGAGYPDVCTLVEALDQQAGFSSVIFAICEISYLVKSCVAKRNNSEFRGSSSALSATGAGFSSAFGSSCALPAP